MPHHPLRIQLSKADGFRVPQGAVAVGAGTVFANPFPTQEGEPCDKLQQTVDDFEDWLLKGPESEHWIGEGESADWQQWCSMVAAIPSLRGKQLASGALLSDPSHADVLAKLANGDKIPKIGIIFSTPVEAKKAG